MDEFRFTVLKSGESKFKNVKSARVLKLPKLKLRYGPKTPVSPHYETMKAFYITKDFKSSSPAHKLIDKSEPNSPKPNFLDFLMTKYEINKADHVDIASKFTKSEEIKTFWTTLATNGYIPDARTGATMSIHNHSIYLFAGEKADDNADLKRLDYNSLIWHKIVPKNTNISEIPVVKSGHVSVVYKNFLIVYGGFNHFDCILQIRNCNSLVYCFDLLGCRWKSFKPTGHSPEPRRNHCAVLVGHSLVVYSGLDCKGNVLRSLAVLNLENMHWGNFLVKGEVPLPRKGFTLSAAFHHFVTESFNFDVFSAPKHYDHIFNKQTSGIYLFGGLTEDGVAQNDIYMLKGQYSKSKPGVTELLWSKLSPSGKPPTGRYNHSAVVSNGFLLILGGRNDSIPGIILNDLCILRISCWRWEPVSQYGEIPSARIGSCLASIENQVLLFGGIHLNEFASSTVYKLETDQKRVYELAGFKRYSRESIFNLYK